MLKDFEINNKLNDAINATIKQNLYSAQRLCKTDDEKNLFRGQETTMVRDARTDMLKFFPGKEIKKIKNRFSIDRKIKSTPLDSSLITLGTILMRFSLSLNNWETTQ